VLHKNKKQISTTLIKALDIEYDESILYKSEDVEKIIN